VLHFCLAAFHRLVLLRAARFARVAPLEHADAQQPGNERGNDHDAERAEDHERT
jgi:hypothetical protein